jgi:hypothetical protein
MKRKNLITFFLIITLVFSWCTPLFAQTQKVDLSFFFDKPSYTSSGHFLSLVQVVTSETIKSVRVRFLLKDPKGEKTIFQKSFYEREISPGLSQFDVSASIPSLNLTESVYPAKVSLSSGGKVLAEKESRMVIVNRYIPPLHLALLYRLEGGIHYNEKGIYLDDEIAKACDTNPDSPGLFYDVAHFINEHTETKFNVLFDPLTLSQIKDLTDGYTIYREEKKIAVFPSSEEALDAKKTLEIFQQIAQEDQVEWLFSTFTPISLPSFIKRGWKSEATELIKEGKKKIKEILKLPFEPVGFFPAHLSLDEDSLEAVQKESLYALVSEASLNSQETTSSYIPPLEKVEVTLFPVKEELFTEEEPYIQAQKIIGNLAQIYLQEPKDKDKVVVLEVPPEKSAINEALITYLSKTPWIKTEKLSDLIDYASINPSPQIKTVIPEEEEKYYDYASRYHTLVDSFLETILPDNPERKKTKDLLYLAEGIYEEDLKNQKEEMQTFFDEINKTVEKSWSNLRIQEGIINLTSQSGNIPLSVWNKSKSPFKVKVDLKTNSNKLVIKEGERRVIVNPKDNTFLIPVSAKEPGEYEISVRLLTPESGNLIKEGKLKVRSTYFTRMFSFWLSLIAIIVILLIFRERRKKRGRA